MRLQPLILLFTAVCHSFAILREDEIMEQFWDNPRLRSATSSTTTNNYNTHHKSANPQQVVDAGRISLLADSMLNCWNIPGFAVALTSKSQVVYQQAFGKRDVAKGLDATVDTAWNVGSVTKHLTALGIGVAKDRGLIDLDTELRQFWPDFQLFADSETSSAATVRDILTHRTGLPRHDEAWRLGGSPTSTEDKVKALRYLEPNMPFRYEAKYNNWGYFLAGAALEKSAGLNWPAVMKQFVFDPIGMPDTVASIQEAQVRFGDKFAVSYGTVNGKATPYPAGNNRLIEPVCPAGCLVSTVGDIARALITQMEGGGNGTAPGSGTRVVKYETLLELQAPLEAFPRSQQFRASGTKTPDLVQFSYGGGVWVGTYRGFRLLMHGGHVMGGSAAIAMLPDVGISGVIICNKGETGVALHNFLMAAIDMLLGIPDTDYWWDSTSSCLVSGDNKPQPKGYMEPRTVGWAYSPSDFVGKYKHPMYGSIDVNVVGNDLQCIFGGDPRSKGTLKPSGEIPEFKTPKTDFFVGNFTRDCCDLEPTPWAAYFPRDDRNNVVALSATFDPEGPDIMFTNAKFQTDNPSTCRGQCSLKNMPMIYQPDTSACEYLKAFYECLRVNVCPVPASMCSRFERCAIAPPSCGT